MGPKTKVFSFCTLLTLLVFSKWFPDLDKLRGRKCPPYRAYKPSFSLHSGKECYQNPNTAFENLSTLEEIQLRGYNASRYKIVSEDGYISTIIRISGSAISSPRKKPSILVFHGIAGSSAHWIIQRGSRNFAFTLVNSGYEVWLADLRGSSPSMKHTHLDPDIDSSYWNFNMDDIATKDLPLFLDLIKNETGNEKVYFACHSTGCAIWLSGLVEVPELNGRFKAGFLMAPAAFFGTMYSPIFTPYSLIFETPLDRLFFTLMKGRYDGRSTGIGRALGLTSEKLCKDWSFLRCGICDNWHFAMHGNNENQLDYENLPNIISKIYDIIPEGLARHQMSNNLNCDFRKFDYGKEKNLVEYGSPEPPTYNLDGIRVPSPVPCFCPAWFKNFSSGPFEAAKYSLNCLKLPVYIYYGENDNIITKVDAERTRDAIPAQFMRGFYKVEWLMFNHVDFVLAKDADFLVYNKILNIMKKFESEEKYGNQSQPICDLRNITELQSAFISLTRGDFCLKTS